MLLSGAPPSFWPYAVTHASTALNLVTHGKFKIPPLEVITGCRQRVMNHLPFSCAAVVVTKQVRERDNKLVARGVAGTFVGRSPDVVGSYLIWVPAHGKIVATADVRFDDESFPWVSGSNRHPPSILAANPPPPRRGTRTPRRTATRPAGTAMGKLVQRGAYAALRPSSSAAPLLRSQGTPTPRTSHPTSNSTGSVASASTKPPVTAPTSPTTRSSPRSFATSPTTASARS